MTGVEREWVGGSFVQVHHGLLRALGGDYETAAVIWAIKWNAGTGWWQASFAELREATCLTRHKLIRALKRAREEGYVESRSHGHGANAPLEWRICWASEERGTNDGMRVPESGTRVPESGPTGRPESGTPSLQKKKTSNPEERAQPRASSATAPVPDGFEEFWRTYPRKTSKATARKAYDKALKKVSHEALVAALRLQAPRWTDPQFIPHAATWLNQERWEDETPAAGELSDEDERMVREWLRINPVREPDELFELGERDPEAAQAERHRLHEEQYARAVKAVAEGWG